LKISGRAIITDPFHGLSPDQLSADHGRACLGGFILVKAKTYIDSEAKVKFEEL
jgi:hypothetical protein